MKLRLYINYILFITSLFISSCSSISPWPRITLFPGLNERTAPQADQKALAQAKADFEQVRNGKPPLHAKPVKTIPGSRSRIYQGAGYELSFLAQDVSPPYSAGPEIVLSSAVTGGAPYRYSEIETQPVPE